MKIVDVMEKVFQDLTFKDGINVINNSFTNFWRVKSRRYCSMFMSWPMSYDASPPIATPSLS